jgi:hypothetical protein
MSSSSIQQSIDIIMNMTKWKILEESLQVLDEKNLNWVAKVSTTHLTAEGHEEQTFTIMAAGHNFITLENTGIPALEKWCQKHHD